MLKSVSSLSLQDAVSLILIVTARLGWALVFGVFLATFVTSLAAHADEAPIRIFAWTPFENSPSLVLPVRQGETPTQAAKRYLAALSSEPDLIALFDGAKLPDFSFGRITEIRSGDYAHQAVLLANTGSDLQSKPERVVKFSNSFTPAGIKAFVLPIAADLGLSATEGESFRNQLTNSFSLMVGMGGDDVDPSLYGRKNRKAIYPTLARDRSEIAVIRNYVSKSEGFFFGTCRGLQLTSVALGYRLIQDLPSEVGSAIRHANGRHDVEILPTRNRILLSASSGQKHAEINTLHHQAVQFKAGGPLEVAARSADGVVEALEFKNGHGLLVQFHPETMNDTLGERILAQVASSQKRAVQRSCSASFLSRN